MTLKERYADTKPIGVYADSAFSGIVILAVEYGIDDIVITAAEYDGRRTGIRRHKIYQTPSGRCYIRKYNRRYYLENFLNV